MERRKPVVFNFFRGQLRIHCIAVGMVVRQGRINMCPGKVLVLVGDFLGAQPHLVPARNAEDGNARPGNARAAAADAGVCAINVPMSVTVAIFECSKGWSTW